MSFINRIWYCRSVLSYPLVPLSLIYRWIVLLRRYLYRCNIKSTYHFSVPVIVVGNITVGGTGKTPFVIYLVEWLKSQGYRPGLVSRGYKGQAKQWPQDVNDVTDPKMVGDEAVMIQRKTQCPMVVGPNRVAAVKQLLKHYDCNVVVSDDGLQHYALGRDIEIALVDGVRRMGNGFCLPAGPLRESVVRLNEVDFIVVNSGEVSDNEFAMQIVPGTIFNIASRKTLEQLSDLKNKKLHAVAGIGHPERFFNVLKSLDLSFEAHVFSDHYDYHAKDIDFGIDTTVIMTEKDAVKCQNFSDHRHWCLPITVTLGNQFTSKFQKTLNKAFSCRDPEGQL